MSEQAKPKGVLQLTIEVPGIWADDLPEAAAMYAEGCRDDDRPTPKDLLEVVLNEWMRREIGITVVSLPGPKSMNDDFVISAHDATVVGVFYRKFKA